MDFYSGLAAQQYDAFFAEIDQQELDFYAQHLAGASGPGLELGCGTGRLLIPLMKRGLCVEGVDVSQEMLAQCVSKAKALGLAPIVHEQQIQSLDLSKKYGCIFSALGTFGQLADRQQAMQALQRCYDHLLPGGTLVVYLHLPWHNALPFGQWHAHEPVLLPDGQLLQVHEKTIHDPIEQQLFSTYRYELLKDNQFVCTQERELITRWYARYEFQLMLQSVGFKVIDVQAGYQNYGPFDVMLFCARK